MPPRLTIAIPTLNRANLLGRAIDSALAQTSSDVEIIVSDNASTDETSAVLERYKGRGVRIFRQAKTIPASRNGEFLINQAQGEFFLGLSDDDYLEPEFAAEVLAHFDRHPELSFVYTGCVFHYEDCQVPVEVGPPIESGPSFIAGHFSGKRVVAWCACVSRVRDLRELGPQPDDRVIGDMYFWTKLAFRGPVGCVPKVMSHYIHLRPAELNDNISHGVPAPEWAHECQLLGNEVLQASRAAGQSEAYIAQLKQAVRRHIARSSANQFIWSRVRGASMSQAWRWVPACMPYLTLSSGVASRMGAALTLPRSALHHLLMKSARKLAASRSLAAKPHG
jgi:hypothetical protein